MSEPTDADELVARAIESVLDAVPTQDDDAPAGIDKYQPWADKAAPANRGKRPLQDLLDEIAERVASEPDAVAASLPGAPPGISYFDRFTPAQPTPGTTRDKGHRRRRSGRGRGGDVATAALGATGGAGAPGRAGAPRDGGTSGESSGAGTGEARGRRRRRSRRRGGHGGAGTGGGGAGAG